MSYEDVVDAIALHSTLDLQMRQQREDASKRCRPIQVGRKRASGQEQAVNALRKRLKSRSSSGELDATAALEKMDEVEEARAVEKSAATFKRKQKVMKTPKTKRKAQVKPAYRRTKGDELRLIRKREIVTCHS